MKLPASRLSPNADQAKRRRARWTPYGLAAELNRATASSSRIIPGGVVTQVVRLYVKLTLSVTCQVLVQSLCKDVDALSGGNNNGCPLREIQHSQTALLRFSPR